MTKTQKEALVQRVLLLAISISMLQTLACNRPTQGSGALTSYSGNGNQSGEKAQLVTVSKEQMAHIQIVTVSQTSLPRTLRLTGSVAYNAFDTTPVITQIGGPASRILVTPGQMVHRGEPLLYVASPDYSQLLANYLKASDAFRLADRNERRAKDLYDHHAIAERDLEAAESTRAQASADLGAAEQSLKILGISKPESVVGKPAASEIPVLAPIAGEAVERLVASGQVVQAGATQVFTISNMNSVWVLANIYQKDLPYVHLGDSVTITADSYPGSAFRGKISYIAAALDPNTRTLQARIDVQNPEGKLKKDMYVVATVQAETIHNALTVPTSAVLRDSENQPFVYVLNATNQFQRRSVTLGMNATDQTQLIDGVAPGERVLADGSLFVQFANSSQR